MMEKNLSIYIHIPFCIKKCDYCDFLSFACEDVKLREEYVNTVIREIKRSEFAGRHVSTVFFGGGTPSILTPVQIGAILDTLRTCFDVAKDAEISLECNPGTATEEKLKGFYDIGINRLSIGMQSANDEELKRLGRVHDFAQFCDTYRYAREAGFTNINVDIMSALPGQSLQSYMDTLDKVVSLGPEHISAYSLIIEEGTPFYEIYGDCEEQGDYESLPDEDTEREMYYETDRRLTEAGYHRYEISNYARDGYECAHNKVYWTGDDYLSFGIGASSYVDGARFSNIEDIYAYMKFVNKEESVLYDDDVIFEYPCDRAWDSDMDPMYFDEETCDEDMSNDTLYEATVNGPEEVEWREGIHRLSVNERMEEFMIVGLRLMCGVSKTVWRKRFDVDIESVYGPVLEKLKTQELIECTDERIRLTTRGIDVSNQVLAQFLL